LLQSKIKTLEKILELYRNTPKQTGSWRICASFYCKNAYQVEILVHQALAKQLDKTAPFGEVFSCSSLEAIKSVEVALERLGLNSSRGL